MDYLSFEPAFPLWPKGDCLVLNSVSNLPKAFPFLSRYDDIYSCLGNDTAGNSTMMAMKEKYGGHVHDLSQEYAGYKDLNEYLCRKR